MNDLATIVTLSLLAAGLAVWSLVGWKLVRREPVLTQELPETPPWGVAVVIVGLFYVGFQLGSRLWVERKLLEDKPKATIELKDIQAASLLNVMLTGVLLLFLSEMGRKDLRDFGIHGKHPGRDVAVGGAGFLASYPLVLLVFLLTEGLRSEERTHSFVRLAQKNPTLETFFWIGVAVVIVAPIAEELVFRVILQGWLRSKLPAWTAIGLSSFCFCAVHGFPDSLALLPLAVILGYVFEKRRSYLAVVVLHALFNAQTLLGLLLKTMKEGS